MATNFVQNYINQLMLEAYSPSRADIDFNDPGYGYPWDPTPNGHNPDKPGDYWWRRNFPRNPDNPPADDPYRGPINPETGEPYHNPIVVPSPIGDPAAPGYKPQKPWHIPPQPKPKPGRPWWYVPEVLPAPGSVPGSDTGDVPWWVLPFVAPFVIPNPFNPALSSITPKSVGSKAPGTVG